MGWIDVGQMRLLTARQGHNGCGKFLTALADARINAVPAR